MAYKRSDVIMSRPSATWRKIIKAVTGASVETGRGWEGRVRH